MKDKVEYDYKVVDLIKSRRYADLILQNEETENHYII